MCCLAPVAILGAICGLVFLIVYPIQMLILIVILVVLVLIIKYSLLNAKKDTINKFNTLDPKVKKLIMGFSKRHYDDLLLLAKKNVFNKENTAMAFDKAISIATPELEMFQQVLEKNNLDATTGEIKTFTITAFYELFERQLKEQYSGLKTVDKIVAQFFDQYDDKSIEIQSLLWHILKIKGFSETEFKKDEIISSLEDKIKDTELCLFEMKLKTDENKLTIEDIDALNGYEFESFLKELFLKMNYTVKQTKLSGDQGADLIAKKYGETFVIQAKQYTGKVSNKAIQEVVASIKHYRADKGIVVTNSYFTKGAMELANSNKTELIDRDKLDGLITKYF
jgi:HJR/Mrr/RecB family endonuclease